VDGRGLGAAGAEDLELGARGIPVVADGLGLDLAVLAAADLADGGDAGGLSKRRGADLLGRLLGGGIGDGVGLEVVGSSAMTLGSLF
jgi:hypothetical protein